MTNEEMKNFTWGEIALLTCEEVKEMTFDEAKETIEKRKNTK
ncbi:hypothetical protein [Clostridium butyricum]|nr:hypothetical protein [Clostridium butyricum]